MTTSVLGRHSLPTDKKRELVEDRNFKGPFYTLGHARDRLKRGHGGSPERTGVRRRQVILTLARVHESAEDTPLFAE